MFYFRSQVNVELQDTTGSLVASLFEDDAENLIACLASKLIQETTQILNFF